MPHLIYSSVDRRECCPRNGISIGSAVFAQDSLGFVGVGEICAKSCCASANRIGIIADSGLASESVVPLHWKPCLPTNPLHKRTGKQQRSMDGGNSSLRNNYMRACAITDSVCIRTRPPSIYHFSAQKERVRHAPLDWHTALYRACATAGYYFLQWGRAQTQRP